MWMIAIIIITVVNAIISIIITKYISLLEPETYMPINGRQWTLGSDSRTRSSLRVLSIDKYLQKSKAAEIND